MFICFQSFRLRLLSLCCLDGDRNCDHFAVDLPLQLSLGWYPLIIAELLKLQLCIGEKLVHCGDADRPMAPLLLPSLLRSLGDC